MYVVPQALEMIDDIRVAFHELLAEVEWMDEKTRVLAVDKAITRLLYALWYNIFPSALMFEFLYEE